MLRTIWRDNERYIDTYWSKFQNRYYVAGDSAHRDADGYYWIMGRIDDVLNVAGHRLGTMEIESALVAHPRIAEAAVVGRPHDVKGESVFAFVVCKGDRPTRRHAARWSKNCAPGSAEQLGAHRQARRHPLRRQPAQDALGKDHAPAAAHHRARRRDHAGYFDAGEPRASSSSCAAGAEQPAAGQSCSGCSRTGRPAASNASALSVPPRNTSEGSAIARRGWQASGVASTAKPSHGVSTSDVL